MPPSAARLHRRLALILAFLLAACASPPPSPSPTSTAPPTLAPSPTPTAAPSQTLTFPHWLSFDYPGDWHRIAGRAPGFAGVASRDIGILPENNLGDDTALFYAFQGNYLAADPLAAMRDERLARLSDGVEILDAPTAHTLAGLPAAALRYRFTLADGAPGIVRLTLLRARDGRYAELWAISREADAPTYAPHFRQMEASVTIHDLLPAPSLSLSGRIPTAYRPVPAPGAGGASPFALSIPPDWRANEASFGLLARPSAVPEAAQIIAGPVPGEAVHADAAAALQTIAQQLLPELIYDAVRVSPISAVDAYAYPIIPAPGTPAPTLSPTTSSAARAYYTGTDQGAPRFIVVDARVHNGQSLYALALLDIPTTSPPALLPIAESILDTLTPTP